MGFFVVNKFHFKKCGKYLIKTRFPAHFCELWYYIRMRSFECEKFVCSVEQTEADSILFHWNIHIVLILIFQAYVMCDLHWQ